MMGDMLGRSIRPNDSDALGARAGSEEFNGGDMAAKFGRLVGPAAAARETAAPALHALKCAQARLLRAQKMAALGQFTAGVAHEIRNPLNFVNNFAELSVALLGELRRAVVPAIIGLDGEKRAEIDEIIETLTMNLEKIAEHGRRAGGIVNNMLLQSHGGRGDWREVDLNALLDQTLSLACHSARAQNQRFDTTVERDFDAGLRTIEIVPQDISRVFLNLIGNGLYAAHQRARAAGESFQPALKVTTRDLGDVVEIRVRDNGIGVPAGHRKRLFQPFFTTKPAYEGTGLGLSISHDIVTRQHGGTITAESEPGAFTEFTIHLPRGRKMSGPARFGRARIAG